LSRYESLECLVRRQRIVVPVRDLDRVVEFALGPPPPLAEPWIAGLGQVDGRPLLCVTLSGGSRGPLPLCKGLLLKALTSRARYLLQVDEVRKVLEIDDSGFGREGVPSWPCPAPWLSSRDHEGETVLLLDSDAAAATLFGTDAAESFGSEAFA
jgi:hypothetical protein